MKEKFISVIIPNRNGSATLERCLESVFASDYSNFEVIVVDDASEDESVEIARRYPCRVVELGEHLGPSVARNVGAEHARGEVLLFIDADCILQRDTLKLVNRAMSNGARVVGGTYTAVPPFSQGFFSTFQSVYVNYCETKHHEADYLATHCLAIDAELFRSSGGFLRDSLMGHTTSVEDVEFSHRLKRAGVKLRVEPGIEVGHIFNFNLLKSLKNAARKSMYWTLYSLRNRDIFADSGAASLELKVNVALFFATLALLLVWALFGTPPALALLPQLLNLYVSRNLIRHFYRARGLSFALLATLYFFLVYPAAVAAGAALGAAQYLLRVKLGVLR
ncbi:MAG: glycosyltransferase [Euryarchaeota archaeon]|nr:glycosyltransferase [Euryarchaeota archaeon]